MTSKKTILGISFFAFLAIMIAFMLDFMSRTTAPWEHKKDSTYVNKYKIHYNKELGLKNIDSLIEARENK
jgi:Na+-transporting methylmalonyl-CoA/oxaloacetate decarboxylase gamma subunit